MIFDLKPESSGKSLSNVTEAEKKERNPAQGVDYCDELDKNKNVGLIQISNQTSDLKPSPTEFWVSDLRSQLWI